MSARLLRCLAVLLGALALVLSAGVAAAAASTSTSTSTSTTLTGPITVLGSSWFSLQTAGHQIGVINALTEAATAITNEDTPYVWGGGHAEAGVASIGSKGPGYTGRRAGFDCSGAVAAVLAGAGLWPSGAGVPADNGIISQLLAEHLIARGVGSAPEAVTLYDDPGVHIFINIDGRFFGTSDGAGGGDAAGGAGWLADSAWDASSSAYRKYHFLPSVLAQKTSYGNDFTFQLPASGLFAATSGSSLGVSLGELTASDLLVGERVRVTYSTNGTGALVVSSIAVISGGPTLSVATPSPVATTPTSPTTTTSSTTTTTTTTVSTTTPTGTPTTVTSPTVTASTSNATPSGTGGAGWGSGSSTGGSPLG